MDIILTTYMPLRGHFLTWMCTKLGICLHSIYPPYLVHEFIEQPKHKKRRCLWKLIIILPRGYSSFLTWVNDRHFFLFDPAICSACRVSNLMILFRIIRCFCFVYVFFFSKFIFQYYHNMYDRVSKVWADHDKLLIQWRYNYPNLFYYSVFHWGKTM